MSVLALNEGEARLASARPDKGKEALDRKHEKIRSELGNEFGIFDPDLAKETVHTPEEPNPEYERITGLQKAFRNQIGYLLEGKTGNASFSPAILSQGAISREAIAMLETEGIVISGINESYPHGGIFVKGLAQSRFYGIPQSPRLIENLRAITATNVLMGVTGLVTRPAIQVLPDPLPEGLPRMPMNCLTVAVYKDGQWSETHVLPDGKWIVEGFDSGCLQYGDGAFEGTVASKKKENKKREADIKEEVRVEVKNGEICMFRLVESARRFIKSCKSIEAPPISVSQFVQAVVEAVRNNKKFIPENGKLYCRAFLAGLQGATGVKPANNYLFAVEVSPYGDYMKGKTSAEVSAEVPKGIRVKCVIHERSEISTNKIAPNYSPVFGLKEKAKEDGYTDVVLLTEDGYIQENSSSNFFAVKNLGGRKFVVVTPSLSTNCLPGITRDSLIQLLRDPEIQKRLGREIIVVDCEDQIHEDDIINYADGAWTTGTAAGITNISEFKVSYCGEDTKEGSKVFDDEETRQFIQDLETLLKDVRCGKVKGYEHWVMRVV